jgi:hypothetical protein
MIPIMSCSARCARANRTGTPGNSYVRASANPGYTTRCGIRRRAWAIYAQTGGFSARIEVNGAPLLTLLTCYVRQDELIPQKKPKLHEYKQMPTKTGISFRDWASRCARPNRCFARITCATPLATY